MAAPATALTIVDRVDASPAIALLTQRSDVFLPFLGSPEAVERLRQGVAVAMVKNPDLLGCTPESIFLSAREAVMQGLEPTGAAGGAHLVPYKLKDGTKVAQLIPDYRGVIRLVTKPGSEVVSVEATVVKEGDEFAYQLGTDAWISHVPSLAPDRSAKATTHAYVVFALRSGGRVVDVMDRTALERIRSRSRSGQQGPWVTDFDEMGKKTVVKRGAKLCPVQPDVRALLLREDELAGETDDDAPAPVITGPTKTSRLARRLKNVTPPEPAAADAGAAGETGVAATDQSADPRRAWLDEHHVSADYALETARRLFREHRGRLSDEQWAEVTAALEAEDASPADDAPSL